MRFIADPLKKFHDMAGMRKANKKESFGSLAPSAELSAFLSTTRFEVFVDGVSSGTTRYGSVAATNAELDVKISPYGASVGDAYASASREICKTTAAEKHEVRLTAHVAGADADPEPMTFSVDVDCSKASSNPVILPDGGGDDRGASGGDDLATSGGGSDGGCSVGGPGPLGRLVSIFGAGAGLAVLLRRRRKQA